jgi:hypothetical protein
LAYRSLNNHDVIYTATCSGEGAILILPDGAHDFRFRDGAIIRDFVIQNAPKWYNYAKGRGLHIPNGGLFLVTGGLKAKSWGSGIWPEASSNEVRFKINSSTVGFSCSWECTGTAECHASEPGNEKSNQCVFMRGFQIRFEPNPMPPRADPMVLHGPAGTGSSNWHYDIRTSIPHYTYAY